MARILVVDDHPLFREGFASMVRTQRPHWTLFCSDDAAGALACFAATSPDLVIVDVGLPGDDGFAVLKAVATMSPATPQILISGREDAAVGLRARACGARGFIAKSTPSDAILATIDAVLAGRIAFGALGNAGEIPALTPRQTEILMLLAEGHGNKEIRHRLNIAERTVRAHLTELFQLLGAHSRMQALLRARELGFIT